MLDFKFLRGQTCYWITKDGKKIPLKALSTSHLANIINCLAGRGQSRIPDPYQGKSVFDWYVIMTTEYVSRITT